MLATKTTIVTLLSLAVSLAVGGVGAVVVQHAAPPLDPPAHATARTEPLSAAAVGQRVATGTITGRVVLAEDGRPVAGAEVRLLCDSDGARTASFSYRMGLPYLSC
jgi:hypothetical protein